MHGVPCGPIYDVADVFEDPQVKARGLVQWLAHPEQGEVPAIGSPIRLSECATTAQRAAPSLGQHTHDIKSALARSGTPAWPRPHSG